MTPPSLASEVVRTSPLTAGALYLNFISTYGAAIVTTLAILYAVAQFYWRAREHRKIMGDKNVESRK
ncbi:holin [Xanthomonas phage vB_Xar_IVIA-DoCa2]|uniref:Holin n=4 Tax=Pradovirus TaxID=1985733 RepID=A0A9X9JN34_9CAUD|nr:holin [Xanthomonas phage vB_Xar_IVIA-DoCa2]UYA98669.1 holin [Xanthomonas phage vB_Xar_IVIA-DoCa4]UYA98984.1 holin [Xanthomonas phage vB_Xar_IVIA-DoCa9]